MTMFCPTDLGPDEKETERIELREARDRAIEKANVSVRRLMESTPTGYGTAI